MGRTKRKRTRKNKNFRSISLESNLQFIELNKWMKINDWHNLASLKLSLFEDTGRGLTSTRNISVFDTLVELPYELMITYTTFQALIPNNIILPTASGKLTIHDALSIFLVIERHKGQHSKWKPYLDTLPEDMPQLPWLCSDEEIENIPGELRSTVEENFNFFKSSWQRSKESINPLWKCECCRTPGHRVLSLSLFTWAYVMVNTRSIYVDPDIVLELSRASENSTSFALSDDPCMALCPYLDMFNHSHKSGTEVALEKVNGRWIYKLFTLKSSESYKEIFICYGSHDNEVLLCEYGFFIPDNELDVLSISFEELLKCIKRNLNEKQYKFINLRQLDDNLYVNMEGLSFNLKAVLFVVSNCDIKDWCPTVFSETYTKEDLTSMFNITKKLVEYKINKSKAELVDLEEGYLNSSKEFRNVVDYLKYRLTFMQKVLYTIMELLKE